MSTEDQREYSESYEENLAKKGRKFLGGGYFYICFPEEEQNLKRAAKSLK